MKFFTFSFFRKKEKGNKKKNRRRHFWGGRETKTGGSAGTRCAQTACASGRRSSFPCFFAPKVRPDSKIGIRCALPSSCYPTCYVLRGAGFKRLGFATLSIPPATSLVTGGFAILCYLTCYGGFVIPRIFAIPRMIDFSKERKCFGLKYLCSRPPDCKSGETCCECETREQGNRRNVL